MLVRLRMFVDFTVAIIYKSGSIRITATLLCRFLDYTEQTEYSPQKAESLAGEKNSEMEGEKYTAHQQRLKL